MNRRVFLKSLMAAGAAGITVDLDRLLAAAPAGASAVGVAEGKDYAAVTERAVSAVGGFGAFVSPGARVVVKPNIGWDRTPEQGANTHPQVVQAVVRGCLKAGASAVLVFDRPCNDARLTYRSSGIQEAVEAVGDRRASVFIPDRRKYVPVDIKDGRAVTRWSFYEDALRADTFINVPILKHHSLCGVTMGLKNIMGVLGDNRGQIHNGFTDKIVDVNTVIRSDLTILDATRILLRHGPQGGDPRDVRVADTVIAGSDVVAVDAYGAKLFGLDPLGLDYLVNAARRGLGRADLGTMEIRKG